MIISRNSRIVKWAYLLKDDHERPECTSLCVLFWRCVLLTPIQLSPVVFMMAGLAYGAYLAATAILIALPLVMLLTIPFTLAVVGSIAMVWLHERLHGDMPTAYANPARPPSVLVEGALSIKRGICPLVEFR